MREVGRAIVVIGMVLAALAAGSVIPPVMGASERRLSQAEPPPAGSGEGTPAKVIDDQEVDGILGKGVRSVAGEDMGRIVDILVDRTGQVRAAVIDFGGFLGVGNRKIAVDWSVLRFPATGKPDRVAVELTRDQVRLAPEYKRGEPIVVLGTSSSYLRTPSSLSPLTEK
jgi:hypothetical protein